MMDKKASFSAGFHILEREWGQNSFSRDHFFVFRIPGKRNNPQMSPTSARLSNKDEDFPGNYAIKHILFKLGNRP